VRVHGRKGKGHAVSATIEHNDSQRLLTAEQVAERWQVPRSQVYRLAREGKLPAVAIGRYYRFRVAALTEWEQRGGATGGGQ
jgi:excisionase family DNA binding protein